MTHIWKIVMSGYLPLLNNLRVISVSHTRDCSYLLRSGWECIQMQSRHLKCEYFPVVRHCRHTNSAPLSIIKSATPPPASVAPSSVVVIISTPMDSSTSSHLSSKPQYLKILVTIMYEFIAELCLIVGNCFPNMHRLVYRRLMRWPILTASFASTGSHRFRMHVFFRDQGGRILIPTVSGPSRAQEEYVRATAWRDIWDTPKEDNERGPR